MTDDNARLTHLMGDRSSELDASERRSLDELADLLADRAVWAVPPDDLEASVVDAIVAEAALAPSLDTPLSQSMSRARLEPVDLAERRDRRWRRALPAALAARAAVFVGVLALVLPGDDGNLRLDVALSAVGAPGPSGAATLERTDAGWEVELQVKGLPRLDNGRYYQAWLRNREGILVPLGSFNEGGRVTLWSGVSPLDYPDVTITVEAADGNQNSSGIRVLAGTVSS